MKNKRNGVKSYVFTFGYNSALGGYYQEIIGDFEETRKIMFDKYGKKWAFQYSKEDFDKSKERYFDDLKPLPILNKDNYKLTKENKKIKA